MGDIATQTNQFLAFRLGSNHFAVDISQVREVLDFQDITPVPKTPDFLLGVINLRGSVISVVDLRLNLNLPGNERTVNTCILIVELKINNDTLLIGTLVDAVEEVIEIPPNEISPPPRAGIALNTAFIQGVGKRGNELLIILDIDHILTTEEIDILETATSIIPENAGMTDEPESITESSI
jgi:purine-binding chemotaxis protein CheW